MLLSTCTQPHIPLPKELFPNGSTELHCTMLYGTIHYIPNGKTGKCEGTDSTAHVTHLPMQTWHVCMAEYHVGDIAVFFVEGRHRAWHRNAVDVSTAYIHYLPILSAMRQLSFTNSGQMDCRWKDGIDRDLVIPYLAALCDNISNPSSIQVWHFWSSLARPRLTLHCLVKFYGLLNCYA